MLRQKNRRITIGLTGSFGSGKSTVARIFKSYGANIIDADKIAHKLIAPGGALHNKVIKLFGTANRRRIALTVFNDFKLLKRLNSLVHPAVIRIIRKEISSSRALVTVLDAPLLLEAGLGGIVDKVIVVCLKKNQQVTRLVKKKGLSKSDIMKRIKAQISDRLKAECADFIIDNSGSVRQTRKQVRKIWKSLVAK